jgi:hypothetical protein
MTVSTLPQPPAFVAAVQEYFKVYHSGVHDMDVLGPLVQRAEQFFNWTPRPPAKPLSKRQIKITTRKWMSMPREHGDRLLVAMEQIGSLPEEERNRTVDMWIAVMEVMQVDQDADTCIAPLGGA